MTNEDRINALAALGYNRDDARFLVLVALHSGYFVRRQYLSFIQGTKGSKDVALFNKLNAKGHGELLEFRHHRVVCHLGSKPLYDAIGENDNRNRRERQPATIKNKLMGLDFVLENGGHQYLATEREKLDYFIRTRGISPEDLPTRWYPSAYGKGATPKHFVDKYPLFLAVPSGGNEPVAHFGYVDEGLQSTDGFATYLSQYSRLLARLRDFRIIYVAQHPGLFPSAGRVFRRFLGLSGEAERVVSDAGLQALLAHFEARQEYEAQDFSRFDTARLIVFREAKKRFAGDHYDALYKRWQTGGAQAVAAVFRSERAQEEALVSRFSTHILRHDYDLFGTLTSLPKSGPTQTQLQTEVQTPHDNLR